MSESAASPNAAPSYSVPRNRIVSVEHPYILKNFHKGLKSLGDEQQLKHVIEHEIGDSTDRELKSGVEPVVGVSLRPDDPFAKKLASTAMPTANVLMKVTLPKWTGRKRKRGSAEAFISTGEEGVRASTPGITGAKLYRRMRDNAENIQVEAVGIITDTHRFKDLPDFQVQGGEVPIMRELQAHVMEPEYEKLSAFRVKTATGDGNLDAIPAPPSFLPSSRPPPKKRRLPEPVTQNSQTNPIDLDREPQDQIQLSPSRRPPPQLRDLVVSLDTQPIPTGPRSDLQSPAPDSAVHQILEKLRELLNERPIYTRRVYWGHFQSRADRSIRRALPHVAYYLDNGPWRYTIVKHGIDPRSDPKCRIYQTFGYSRVAIVPIQDGSAYGHPPQNLRIFDGTRVVDPSETWQLCDLTEPLIQRIVHTENIRSEYDSKWGWYYNGTTAKILVLTREKMIALANPGRKEQLSDEEYEVLANLPDLVRKAEECHLDRSRWPTHVCKLAEAIGDEAVQPTFMGIRGYDEVVPNRFSSLLGGEGGVRDNEDGDEGAEQEVDDDDDGGQVITSNLPQEDEQDADWVEDDTTK